MSSGIGLGGFLDQSADDGKGGGGSGFLSGWKDKKEVVIWLHTRVQPVTLWGHQFIEEAEIKERDEAGKETGKQKRVLRFPRFPSPDPKEVHARQYFREKGISYEPMQTPPVRDPFLLLREWLRLQGKGAKLPLDQIVFEWTDHKNRGALISWRLGELSKLVKTGQSNFNHTLDSKYEGLFAVVDDADLEKGVTVAREGKLLTELMREVIKEQVDSRGVEEGDPTRSPYAFKWKFDKDAKSPMDTYKCYRFDRAAYTEAVFAAITSEEVPDLAKHATFQEDDLVKVRAAFEAAAQIQLPLDQIFSDDADVRASVLDPRRMPTFATGTTTSDGGAQQARKPAANPPSKPGAAKPPATTGGPKPPSGGTKPPAAKPAAAAPKTEAPPETPAPGTGGRRRKKVADEAPPPPPEPERIKCEDCDYMLLPTDAKCPQCGAEYEVDPDEDAAPAPAPTPAPKQAAPKAPASGPKPPSGGGPKPPSGGGPKKPAAAPAPDAEGGASDADDAGLPSPDECFACGSKNITNGKCDDCGIGQSADDDIPF